jgi:hypothetical protein
MLDDNRAFSSCTSGANDDAQKLAKGLRAALDKIDVKKS